MKITLAKGEAWTSPDGIVYFGVRKTYWANEQPWAIVQGADGVETVSAGARFEYEDERLRYVVVLTGVYPDESKVFISVVNGTP